MAQELKRFKHVQKDGAKPISATGQDMKLGVSSANPTPQSTKPFEQKFSEQCSIAPETQAPKSSSKEGFQPMPSAAEIVRQPPGTMKVGMPQKIVSQKATKKPKKDPKPPHPNCTKPRLWLADERVTMPMPDYPEPWQAPPPLPTEVPKRLVLNDTARNFLVAQSAFSMITVQLVDDYGFTSFCAPIRAPGACDIVPEYLVSTATLRLMGFLMDSVDKIWRRYLRNEENRSMKDENALLFYAQRFIQDTYADAVSSERGTDSDTLIEEWSLADDLRVVIRREARARDPDTKWRPFTKIADLESLKLRVIKKVSEKFRAFDKLSYEIEKIRNTKPAGGFAPLARRLEYW